MKLPNFCKNSVLLGVMLYTQLFVVLHYLLISSNKSFQSLGYVTLYAQWISLGTLFLLCFFRDWINKHTAIMRFIFIAATCLFVFLVVDLASYYLEIHFFQLTEHNSHFIHRFVAAVLIIFLVLRFGVLLQIFEERHKAEMAARMEALQSRIRPHFLFNSLNIISELTATEPKQAEKAINSLSMLFRANLESKQGFHSLESELSLCRHYVDLEKWRIGEKLEIEWSIEVKEPGLHKVPKLILQPLIENCFVHGQRSDGCVFVKVDVRETKRDLSMVVENKKGSRTELNTGHGVAIDNIRERLFVLYDDQQTFRIRETSNSYRVLMRFPKRV